ncbi:MAG TPA: hypothetical protein VMT81_00880 [Candidatus Paceibacterota bacterium]|nr:hypothetical protein [Candidatus Paceibacterota bacterium]
MRRERIPFIAIFIGTFAAVVFAAGATVQAQASQPQFLMTWQAAGSSVPAGYAGKALPNQASQIVASLELISPQGQTINLGGQTIYWYVNDNFIGGGIGAQRITFLPYGTAPNTLALKAELPNYPGGLIVHQITIPVAAPEAVVEAPFPGGQFSAGPIVVQALPYFFSATSSAPLSFTWSVNGQTVSNAENPQSLRISLPQSTPAGFAVQVGLVIRDSDDAMTGTGGANLTYQP